MRSFDLLSWGNKHPALNLSLTVPTSRTTHFAQVDFTIFVLDKDEINGRCQHPMEVIQANYLHKLIGALTNKTQTDKVEPRDNATQLKANLSSK
jgi:hypothetical protein